MTLGDLSTEETLLDPLAKSVLQYCRLLVPDDQVKAYKIRSLKELTSIWGKEHALYSHVIFVGHGSCKGFCFSNDGWATIQSSFSGRYTSAALRRRYLFRYAAKPGSKLWGAYYQKWHCAVNLSPLFTAHMAPSPLSSRRPSWPFTYYKVRPSVLLSSMRGKTLQEARAFDFGEKAGFAPEKNDFR